MFKAQFPGHCSRCRTAIRVGEQIQKHPVRGYEHVGCVATVANVKVEKQAPRPATRRLAGEPEDEFQARRVIDIFLPLMNEAQRRQYGIILEKNEFFDGEPTLLAGAINRVMGIWCRASHYFLNNGHECPLPVFEDGLCEDHWMKEQEAEAERMAEREYSRWEDYEA